MTELSLELKKSPNIKGELFAKFIDWDFISHDILFKRDEIEGIEIYNAFIVVKAGILEVGYVLLENGNLAARLNYDGDSEIFFYSNSEDDLEFGLTTPLKGVDEFASREERDFFLTEIAKIMREEINLRNVEAEYERMYGGGY
jgi:hypothetical protein